MRVCSGTHALRLYNGMMFGRDLHKRASKSLPSLYTLRVITACSHYHQLPFLFIITQGEYRCSNYLNSFTIRNQSYMDQKMANDQEVIWYGFYISRVPIIVLNVKESYFFGNKDVLVCYYVILSKQY